jgi:hypothetical protein
MPEGRGQRAGGDCGLRISDCEFRIADFAMRRKQQAEDREDVGG